MKELLRTNDPVRLSWLQALLAGSGIEAIILDTHTSIIEGSIGAIPRRLMVLEEDHPRAEAVPAEAGETVLDAGCGVGAASLCLAKRVPDCRITGIEAQRDLVRLANENAALNRFADRIVFMAGDILRPPPRLDPGSFHHVMAN